MRRLAFVVAKDESGKFLVSWLKHYSGLFDAGHVFDDRSTDATSDMFRAAGWSVTVRREGPSFLDHEGEFRQNGWDAASRALDAEPDDLVFTPDCDEFLMGEITEPGVYDLPLDELWRLEPPWQRVDGAWGRNHGERVTLWEPGAQFRDARCGPGSIPVTSRPRTPTNARMLHYGYTLPGANVTKHERYSDMAGNRHSPGHIRSLLTKPRLEPYLLPTPDVKVG